MEFAVIETGGKQYKVTPGMTLSTEAFADGERTEGDKVVFDRVLLVSDGSETTVGTPYVTNAQVHATFVEEGKGKKIPVIRFRSKSRHFKRKGHRQPYAKVTIDTISAAKTAKA